MQWLAWLVGRREKEESGGGQCHPVLSEAVPWSQPYSMFWMCLKVEEEDNGPTTDISHVTGPTVLLSPKKERKNGFPGEVVACLSRSPTEVPVVCLPANASSVPSFPLIFVKITQSQPNKTPKQQNNTAAAW